MNQQENKMDAGRSANSPDQEIRRTIRQVTSRQWRLWLTAMTVVILLVLCIGSFLLPGLLSPQVDTASFRAHLNLAVRILAGVVFLFSLHVVRQQLQIRKIELSVDDQLDTLAEVQERTEQASRQAGLDNLTDLCNRQLGEQRLAEEIFRSRRHKQPLTIMRVDLDGLDKVCEQLGFASADCVIRQFAQHLQDQLRISDIPVRLDRGQFLILLPDCNLANAEAILTRIDLMKLEFGDEYRTTLTAGWAEIVEGETSQGLVLRAETMLHGKRVNTVTPRREVILSLAPNGKDPLAKLKQREREVFILLAQCKSNKEVANALNLSVRTVETHRARIMSALDLHSGSELVMYAARNKVIG
ncbi:MAG: diguanylate cyclase [Candidatus Acidiferrum sp.]